MSSGISRSTHELPRRRTICDAHYKISAIKMVIMRCDVSSQALNNLENRDAGCSAGRWSTSLIAHSLEDWVVYTLPGRATAESNTTSAANRGEGSSPAGLFKPPPRPV